MSDSSHKALLPVLSSPPVTDCGGCGACCMELSVPPFLDEIDFLPRELQQEVIAGRMEESDRAAQGLPCIWFDSQTLKCRHYEHRPNICREFETGGDCCLETRERRATVMRIEGTRGEGSPG